VAAVGGAWKWQREKLHDGVQELTPRRYEDERGFFTETYDAATFAAKGIDTTFVQDKHSYSTKAGTLRELHYRLRPRAGKARPGRAGGRVFDVAVELRRGSPTFAKWVGIELSAEKSNQILVPAGVAHRFVTREPDTEILYKMSDFYSPDHDRAVRFDDPEIAIDWSANIDRVVISAKDRNAPLLANATVFEGTGDGDGGTRILVTGGAGFIGSAVHSALLYRIRRRPQSRPESLPVTKTAPGIGGGQPLPPQGRRG